MPRWGGSDGGGKENNSHMHNSQSAATLIDRVYGKDDIDSPNIDNNVKKNQNDTPNSSELSHRKHQNCVMDDPQLFTFHYIHTFSPRSEEAMRRKGILPKEIVCRSLSYFEKSLGKNLPHEVATIRYNHYENKRKALIRTLRKQRMNMVNSGWEPMAHTMPPIGRPNHNNRTNRGSRRGSQTATEYQTPNRRDNHENDGNTSKRDSIKNKTQLLSSHQSTPNLRKSKSSASVLSPAAMNMVCSFGLFC